MLIRNFIWRLDKQQLSASRIHNFDINIRDPPPLKYFQHLFNILWETID